MPVAVVRKVVQLLSDQGRFADAQAALRKVPEQVRTTGGLDRTYAQLTLLTARGPGAAATRKEALAAGGRP